MIPISARASLANAGTSPEPKTVISLGLFYLWGGKGSDERSSSAAPGLAGGGARAVVLGWQWRAL